jgi:hypothetical protein
VIIRGKLRVHTPQEEAVVVYFKIFSWYFISKYEKFHERLSFRTKNNEIEIRVQHLSNKSQLCSRVQAKR